MSNYKYIEAIEKNLGLFGMLLGIALTLGGLAEIVPLFYQAHTVKAAEGVKPYAPLELAGRDIYVSEGCYGCHSQQIRRLRAEVQRYGPFSRAGESVYDRPFQWGSKRTGPDLSRIGGKYSDAWHRQHLLYPRSLVPDSNMPAYKWLDTTAIDPLDIQARMKVLRILGDPYSDAEIDGALDVLQNKTELDALIAYLQGLGHAYPFKVETLKGGSHE
ncbi:MAG: cytochrome-c oxidase, cbb3-type subunit II [Spongiibacteraceae bacterium]|nr:cytochrome-c oxidase, cbb3-type subunit II [Spongiibacteraceae bacterium]|tara:strand:+ start:974 stop:1621 length:648 start_codon:yes stop_codon:yes gene_type:complete